MKKIISLTVIIIIMITLAACNKEEQVNIYGIGEEVSFSHGTIVLNEYSINNGDQLEFCFTLDLEQEYCFDDLFSRYDLTVGNETFTLRETIINNTQEYEIVNHETNYIIYIGDAQVGINDLTNVHFLEGTTSITYCFSENYDRLLENEVSFTVLNDTIDFNAVFMM